MDLGIVAAAVGFEGTVMARGLEKVVGTVGWGRVGGLIERVVGGFAGVVFGGEGMGGILMGVDRDFGEVGVVYGVLS